MLSGLRDVLCGNAGSGGAVITDWNALGPAQVSALELVLDQAKMHAGKATSRSVASASSAAGLQTNPNTVVQPQYASVQQSPHSPLPQAAAEVEQLRVAPASPAGMPATSSPGGGPSPSHIFAGSPTTPQRTTKRTSSQTPPTRSPGGAGVDLTTGSGESFPKQPCISIDEDDDDLSVATSAPLSHQSMQQMQQMQQMPFIPPMQQMQQVPMSVIGEVHMVNGQHHVFPLAQAPMMRMQNQIQNQGQATMLQMGGYGPCPRGPLSSLSSDCFPIHINMQRQHGPTPYQH